MEIIGPEGHVLLTEDEAKLLFNLLGRHTTNDILKKGFTKENYEELETLWNKFDNLRREYEEETPGMEKLDF